ncbi:MAG: DUF4214 domain-containing protein [Acidimicrobiales bacterium]
MVRSALALGTIALASTLLAAVSVSGPPAGAATTTPVMQRARVDAADLAGWFRSKGKVAKATVSIDALATYFIEEGADEGVAGDLAFAQSIVETGYFTFSTRVPASFNNFSGLGAVDGGSSAASFADARTGVRAQIQHLRAYGDPTVTTAKLHHPLVDPRFTLVSPKGKAPTWEQFGNGIWATDATYASKVLAIYQQILTYADATPTTTKPPTTTTTTTTPGPPDPRWAPLASAGDVADRAYGDILGRKPTAGERAAAVAALEAGLFTPGTFVATVEEEQGAAHAEPVARLYLAALGRLPDRNGLQYWTRRHDGGTSIAVLAQQFLASSEFARRYGAPTDDGYVAVLYRNVLGRAGDPSGVDYWSRRLADGRIDRRGLLVQFSESSEHKARTAAATQAAVAYLGMVLRPPSSDELTWWQARRSAGAPMSELTTALWGSAAFAQRA